jgi:sugar phosphate isomerase/epimerase
MNYAFMTFSTPELAFDEVLKVAQQYGYNGVEIRTQSSHRHGLQLDAPLEVRRAARRKAAEAGIALCCVATSCRFADERESTQMLEDARRALDLAADIGSPRLRVFGGSVPESTSRADASAIVAQSLSALAPYAAARGVVICLETHDDWCDPRHVAAVLAKVNHANVAANWDVMHPVRLKLATIAESYDVLKPWIEHVHVHDGVQKGAELTLTTMGEGEIDHRPVIELLMRDGYEGYISGEWINFDAYEAHLPRELGVLKKYEEEVISNQ